MRFLLLFCALGAMGWGQNVPVSSKAVHAVHGKLLCASSSEPEHVCTSAELQDWINPSPAEPPMFVPAVKDADHARCKPCLESACVSICNYEPIFTCEDKKRVLLSSEDGTIHTCMRIQ